jgi:isoleucyl-tRNA synthetase
VAAAIEALDHAAVDRLATGGTLEVATGGGSVAIAPDDVVIRRTPRPGQVVGSEGPLSVALDVTLDDALLAEGLAREVVSRIQSLRRDRGLDVTDRIEVTWDTDDERLATALARHADLVSAEVLARTFTHAPVPTGGTLEVDDATLRVILEKVAADET